MFSAFRTRRPWASALINFIFDPVLGMLYLNRGYIALAYFLAEVVAVVAVGSIALPALSAHFVDSWLAVFLAVPFRVAGAAHAYQVARQRSQDETQHWYTHWYALILIYLVFLGAPLGIRTYLFQPFDLPTSSMVPTLNKGDYFLVRKFAYAQSPPQRGDLI